MTVARTSAITVGATPASRLRRSRKQNASTLRVERDAGVAPTHLSHIRVMLLFHHMFPIVLHHGLLGFTDVGFRNFKLSYFRRIDRALEERGHPLIIPSVHPTGSIEL